MNTPKLINILSSATGAVDPARFGRASDPVHGLDFSQLLGEKRSQPSAPAVTQRSAQTNTSSSHDTRTQARVNTAPARQEHVQRESVPANSPSPAASGTAEAGNNPVVTQQNQPAQSGDQTANGQASADTSNTQTSGTQAQGATDTGNTEENAQLAQAAAEAGLVAAVTGQALQAATQPQAPGAQAAPAQGTPAPATAQALAMQPALHAETGLPPNTDAPANHQSPGTAASAQQHTPATPLQAALAQALQNTQGTEPATASAKPADAPQAAAATTLPVSTTDISGTAAALSLQDFTAMVAAARATSGTTLPLQAGLAPQALGAAPLPTPMAGLLPAGMFPGQTPAGLPLAAGISAPLASPQWSTEFGRQFINIAQGANGLGQVAELRLDPPDLGPLRITINLNDGVAHAVFSSPHAQVRQTVENALPQLQQMLEQAGISLGQTSVNDQHQSGQASEQQSGNGRLHAQAGNGSNSADSQADHDSVQQGRSADPNALVDTFA